MLRPGFEPGSVTREATILDRTILPERGFSVHTVSPVLIYFPLSKNQIKLRQTKKQVDCYFRLEKKLEKGKFTLRPFRPCRRAFRLDRLVRLLVP